MYLPENVALVYSTGLATFMMTSSSPFHYQHPIELPNSQYYSAICDEHPDYCKREHNTALSKELRAIYDNVHNFVGAVHYKHRTDRKFQINEDIRQEQVAIAQLHKNWCKEVTASAWYYAYLEPFMNILSQFQLMWNGLLGRINVSKHWIELLQPDKASLHSASDRADPKTRKFEIAEIYKMLAEKLLTQFKPHGQPPLYSCPRWEHFTTFAYTTARWTPKRNETPTPYLLEIHLWTRWEKQPSSWR